MPNTRKRGKKMKFSQPVIGNSASRKKKPSVGMIFAPSAGTVDKTPMKTKLANKGKKVF